MLTVHTDKGKTKQVADYLKSEWNKDPAQIHNLYKEWFNLVDITNKYWYDVQETHKNQKWKNKFLFAILRFYIYNVWAIYSNYEFMYWKDFRASLASKMTQYFP